MTATATAPRAGFLPPLASPELAARLKADGYNLPASWPYPVRVITSATVKEGWQLVQPGSIRKDHPHFTPGRMESLYIAPDGTVFTACRRGQRPVLIALSKITSPLLLRVADGRRAPTWARTDRPKGEAPASLKPFLLKKGERLEKGVKREAAPAPVAPPEAAQQDPRIADVDRRIQEQRDRGDRPSPGLLALRTRLLRGGFSPRPAPTLNTTSARGRRAIFRQAREATAAPVVGLTLDGALASWNVARLALEKAEEDHEVRSIPARRAILTRRTDVLRRVFDLHAEVGAVSQSFTAWLQEKVGQGIALPEPRRSLHLSGPRTPHAPKAPANPKLQTFRSRAGVLASGLVTITATPKQLDRRKAWWTEDGKRAEPRPAWEKVGSDIPARTRAEVRSTGLPYWLRRPRSPREEALAMIHASEAASRAAGRYIVTPPVPPKQMSQRQREAVLAAQARRLAGTTDSDLNFTVAPEQEVAA